MRVQDTMQFLWAAPPSVELRRSATHLALWLRPPGETPFSGGNAIRRARERSFKTNELESCMILLCGVTNQIESHGSAQRTPRNKPFRTSYHPCSKKHEGKLILANLNHH